jgi:hypothetical protein
MIYFLLYCLVGICSGLIAGLFGIGGGIVIVPVLILTLTLADVPESILTQMAIATSLSVIIINSLASIYTHQRHKAIRWVMLRPVMVGTLLGVIVGVQSALYMSSDVLKLVFGVFLLFVAMMIVFRPTPKPVDSSPGWVNSTFAGTAIGWVSAMLGIGGGTLSVPYFIARKLPMNNAVALGAACGLPISIMATAAYIYEGWHMDISYSLGYVYLPALVGIAITSIPSAAYGAGLAHRVNPRHLRIGFASVLCLVGLTFIFK